MDADQILEQMVASQALLDFAAGWEGSRLVPYQDSAGFWTVGRGHKMQPTDPHVAITPAEQDALFQMDMLYTAEGVARLVYMPIEQCQFDALCDFAFNCGLGNLAGSTLRKRVNGGYFDEAADEFAKWNIAGGKPDPGLTKRRTAERAMFVSADYSGRP